MERSAVGSKVRPENGAAQIKSNGRVIVIINSYTCNTR